MASVMWCVCGFFNGISVAFLDRPAGYKKAFVYVAAAQKGLIQGKLRMVLTLVAGAGRLSGCE